VLRPVLVALGACLLGGCSTLSLEFGEPVDPLAVARLEPGKSTLQETLEVLGTPYDISEFAGGYALIYEHLLLDELQVGISGDFVQLEIFKFIYGKSGAEHSATVAVIRPDLILGGLASDAWPEDIGTAGGIQLFFDVESVVESKDLALGHDSLDWGATCLIRLPSALNQQHQADLYLRGIPIRAGQLTLELQTWRDPGRR
jgi:hypothetical protein